MLDSHLDYFARASSFDTQWTSWQSKVSESPDDVLLHWLGSGCGYHLAVVINLGVAVIVGASLPVVLKSLNIDPALAGTIILTTILDVVGFMSFLGLATIFYGSPEQPLARFQKGSLQ